MKDSRMLSPDVARAIAIIMVVWGHLIQVLYTPQVASIYNNVLVYRLIYSVHMPLFMLISGYFFYFGNNKQSFVELSKKRVVGILVPILIWNTLHYLINLFFGAIYMSEGAVSLKAYTSELLEGYWFLWAILLFSIVMSFAHGIKNIYIRVAAYLVCALAFL